MIGKTIAHYRIIEKLGEGGMGVVYKAEDSKLKRIVALKFVHPNLTRDENAKQRFMQEARAASGLDHPNICTIYEIDETRPAPGEPGDGQMFIAMAHYEGQSLADIVGAQDAVPLPVETAVDYAIQIAEGLARTHEAGIMHRDMKPANIMVTDRGEVKIVDFGLAKLAGETRQTGIHSTLGTVAYTSPEQVESEKTDERADIWALGVILYEMLTGQQPFQGEADQVIIYSIVNEEPRTIAELRPEVPAEIAEIVTKTLTKTPEERYQQVQELLEDLHRCRTLLMNADSSNDKSFPATSLWKKAWVNIGGVLLLLTATILYLSRPSPQGPATAIKLAILPFENRGSADDQYFTDGLTEEIVERLGNIANLQLLKGTSMSGSKSNLDKLGTDFGVDYILNGALSLRTSSDGSDSVYIEPQILRVSDRSQVWSHNYRISLDDIFQTQALITEQVASALNIQLPQPQENVVQTRSTTNLQAYDYYLRGLMHARQSDQDYQLKQAYEKLSKSIQLEPNFALAHAWLSITHSMMFWFHFDRSQERIAMAKASADEALKLAPDLSEAYQALGHYYYRCHLDYPQALSHFETALKIKPNDDHTLLGMASVKRREGEFKEAVDYFERAVELNPQGPGLPRNTAQTYELLREFGNAERYYDLAISFAPNFERLYAEKAMLYLRWYGEPALARSVLTVAPHDTATTYRPFMAMAWFQTEVFDGNCELALAQLTAEPQAVIETQFYYVPKALLFAQIYGLLEDLELRRAYYDSARVHLQAKLLEQPNDHRLYSSLGIAYAGLGQTDKAIRSGQKGVEMMPISREAWKGLYRIQDLAQIHVMVGNFDAALDRLEYLLSVPGELTTTLLRMDPTWAPLRDHPRFKKFQSEFQQL